MKDTLVIAYNGGVYGTYLEWALNTLMSSDAIMDPFTDLGNSHRSKLGNHVGEIDGFDEYIASDRQYLTVRLHPKSLPSHNVGNRLNHVLDHVPRLVLLYPDRTHALMCACNYMTKIWPGHMYDGAMAYINPDDIFNNWPLGADIDLKSMPQWIMREHMSFNLFSSWHDQVEWYLPDVWQHSRALIVTTKQLFENFEQVLENIINFWGVAPVRPTADLVPSHEKMLSLQTHLGKDLLCNNIIDSVLGNADPVTWGHLCMVSQAWIQHQLRQRGYELLCHDLNNFPSDTAGLKSVVVKSTII